MKCTLPTVCLPTIMFLHRWQLVGRRNTCSRKKCLSGGRGCMTEGAGLAVGLELMLMEGVAVFSFGL